MQTKICALCGIELPLTHFGRKRKGAADGRLDYCRNCGTPSSVMVYGLGDPIHGADEVEQQIELARAYQNRLIEVARNERAAWYEIMRRVGDVAALEWEVAELTAWIDTAVDQIQKIRQKAQARVPVPVLSSCVKVLKVARSRRQKWLSGLRKAAMEDPEISTALEAMQQRVDLANKALRADRGDLYWGTYLLIEDSVKQAVRDARKQGRPVRFVPWHGYSKQVGADGRVSVQIQKGMPVAEMLGGSDTRVRIEPGKVRKSGKPRSERHRRHREKCDRDRKNSREPLNLWLRVRSDENGAPVWAIWPMLVSMGKGRTSPLKHRPLPDDAAIKRVTVQRRRIGTKFRWQALISYTAESLRPVRRIDASMAGLDVGWRVVDGGLRIAYLVDDLGEHRELVLPNYVLEKLDYADSLRSIRDGNFDALRPRLVRWLRENPHPEWLAHQLRNLQHWRSMAKMARVVHQWAERRFEGDDEIFVEVDGWRRRDRHLYQIEAGVREKVIGHRRDIYRCWAKELAERYATIVVEDFDLRKMAKHVAPEDDKDERGARAHRHAAAVSEFRQALDNACRRRGGEIRKRPAKDTTRKCHCCGKICLWDAAEELEHVCEHCGESWDQDENAGKNLLQDEQSGGDETPGTARYAGKMPNAAE